jgi:hypothetical protein
VPSPKRNPRTTNGHRRRQLRARVLREETHCGICGLEVDTTLPAGRPDSPECDEILAVSRGGSPFERSNARLAHRLCNQRRGAGMNDVQRRRVPDFVTRADMPVGDPTGGGAPRGSSTAIPSDIAPDAPPHTTGKGR